METKIFSNSDKSGYSEFVASHPSGSFLQSWSWGDFQNQQGKEAVRLGLSKDGQLVATVQVLKTKIPFLPGYYVYAPYGPLINPEVDVKAAVLTLESFLFLHFNNAWFARLEPKDKLPLNGQVTQRIQPSKTFITDITQNETDLLAQMHPKTRYNIKVAEKHGVTVESQQTSSQHAIALLTATAKRQGYHSYPGKYYQNLIDFFAKEESPDCKVYTYSAKYEGKVIATALMIDQGLTRTYLFGGSDDGYRNLMAPYALHWQAIRDAKANGLTKYDWWGIETSTGKQAGFVQFKLKWGGKEVAYPPAVDVVRKPIGYSIYKMLRAVNRLF